MTLCLVFLLILFYVGALIILEKRLIRNCLYVCMYVHFNDGVLCNTKLAAMGKRFGLKSSNFFSGYYQCMSK